MLRLLGAFRACWLRKERLETEQLEQLEAGVFSAGAKHRPAWHQYSRKEEIHPAFYMRYSTFPLLGAEAEVTGLHSCTWNSAARGLGQRRAISSIPINPWRPLPSWQYAGVPVLSLPPPPRINLLFPLGGPKKNPKFLSWFMSTLISLSHKCEKYVATPASRGLNTKTQRERIQLTHCTWFVEWLWKASIGIIR